MTSPTPPASPAPKRRHVLTCRFDPSGYGVSVEKTLAGALPPGSGNWNTAPLVVTVFDADEAVERRYTDSREKAAAIAEALFFEHGRRRTARPGTARA